MKFHKKRTNEIKWYAVITGVNLYCFSSKLRMIAGQCITFAHVGR